MLTAARAATIEALRALVSDRVIAPSDPKLIRYLQVSMGAMPHEVLRVLFLDASRRMIADEQMQHGTIAQMTVYPRTIFRRALELNAAAIILVHNHPSGDPSPSRGDVEVTDRLVAVGHSLDIDVIEHIVVTSSDHRMILQRRSKAGAPQHDTLRDSAAGADDCVRALANARRTARRRLLRRQLMGADDLFGEPAWDMLIDLFIQEGEGRPVSTSSSCIASGLPMSTALRLLQRLCDTGIVTREADRDDGRRNFIRLAPEVAHRLNAYFSAGDE